MTSRSLLRLTSTACRAPPADAAPADAPCGAPCVCRYKRKLKQEAERQQSLQTEQEQQLAKEKKVRPLP